MLVSVLYAPPANAQRLSQPGSVGQTINETDVTITYNRPTARGRSLFGGIVPHDQPWNPGADEATEIALSTGVSIAGHRLPAGRYTIWMVPRRDRFTVIFSRATGVNHSPYPGADQDALRVDLPTSAGPHMEVMAFSFPLVGSRDATLRFHWGATIVDIPVIVP